MTVLTIRQGALSFGERTLWRSLDLDVQPGEFVAVLGANGSGKTSLLRAILGQQKLDSGTIELGGQPVHRGDRRIGYIPQQRLIAPGTPLRGRDLVTLGINGHRFGLPFTSSTDRRRADAAIAAVGATAYADQPMGALSGGEQQRLRVAQATASDPLLLLADEPLTSLDLAHQRGVAELLDQQRTQTSTAVIFVTHDINPVLSMVDRVLYLAQGRFTVGTPDEVLRSEVLSSLYGTDVEVFRRGGRVFVAGAAEAGHH
ncbi:zinc/manganese transport system ATP-binding protein [Microbacteriaceae bacterium SG_E_30_P1]|uniref:Zinc/manganese transport system ATP-binding protein n=1 Tax=Antiquaquibacter oligotrophicus TaxID=2880260 RepID=A0ABT6KT81_9MICO|nr:ATP-binding cassette domain-containing protein [Antiquaquibacter oligotrophicus]MDH6182402.1 zinc/manganese transport system ATP-binding protein [Antiquaquibacter oligotrophicus]UDF14626.1 ATP-binding cassette domain-containing protein [Antiquaquibacter oligotrophicus]